MTTPTQNTWTPCITWLNMTGDITITWDKAHEADVLNLIEQKMKDGYHFFVLKPRFLPFLPKKKVALTSADQLAGATSVTLVEEGAAKALDALGKEMAPKLDDAELEAGVRSGKLSLLKGGKSSMVTSHRTKNPEEVLRSQSVAVRPIVGG
ncbi:hypothetical protein LC612_39575 [Nostoc sp. CHAB 5834]|nr:hypothetical protein [Nostoc sp. CHAB 5834]